MKLPDANKDFNADKENAAITVSLKSDEKVDQAVVFNSKRSKVPIVLEKQNRKTLLANSSTESLQRNGRNVNYGSPNIISGNNIHKRERSSFSGSRPKRKTKTDRNDMSDTVSVHKVVIKQKKKTINDNSGNVSKTQAFHKYIICQAAILGRDVNAKRTNVFGESRNTLMTGIGLGKLQNSGATLAEQRRGVYKDDTYNKSRTQAVSYNKKHKAKEYESDQDSLSNKQTLSPNKKENRRKPADNDKDNISMTQVLSSNVLDENANKRVTIVSDDKAVPASIMLSDKQTKEKCRTIHKNDGRKITVTKAVHLNIILFNNETNKGKQTVVHESNKRNLSTIRQTTQQLKVTPEYRDEKPIADFDSCLKMRTKKTRTIVYDNDVVDAPISGNKIEEPRNKGKTYDDDEANISLSIANNYEIGLAAVIKKPEEIINLKPEVIDDDIMKETIDKMKLIDYDEFETDKGDVSGTEPIAAETESLAYDDDINLTIPTNTYLLNNLDSEADIATHKDLIELKQAIIDIDLHLEDILKQTEETLQSKSKFTAFNASHLTPQTTIPTIQIFSETDKNRTVMCDKDKCTCCNISVVQPISAELITVETEFNAKKSKPICQKPNITVLQTSTINSRQKAASINENIYSKESFYCDPPIVSVKNTNEPKVSSPVVSAPITPISEIPRFLHPKDMEKLQVKQISSTTDSNIDKVFDGDDDIKIQIDVKEKKGSQSSLLDRTIDRGTGDKTSNPSCVVIRQDTAAECMFYVMKDSKVAIRSDRRLNSAKLKDENNTELKKVMAKNNDIPSRSVKEDKIDEHDDFEQQNFNQSIADITRELLSLISNMTGNVTYEDDDKPAVMKVENRDGQATKHKRQSPVPNRQSIAFGNSSEAQTVLQKSRVSDCADKGTRDTSVNVSEMIDRTSHKVEKTTFSVESIKYEDKCAPLKKTTFDESSHIIDETKKKVIPTYPSEVSEGIKELMLDLVKPVSDNDMIENELINSENTTMHSAQIQANLDTSGHIDKTAMHKDVPVLVFDYHNPLHNILLAPPDLSDVHKYNPRKTYEVETLISRKQEKICVCQKDNHFTTYPSTSKKSRVECEEQCVDAVSTRVMHDEANTIITMRRNEELLQASSSLTIVEDVTKIINRTLTSDNSTFANHWRFSSQIDTEEEHRGVNSSHSRVSATFSNKHICNHATDKNKQNSASMEMIPKIQKSPYASPNKGCTKLSSTDKMGPIKQQYNKNASQVAEMKSPRNNLTYIYFVEQSIQPAALIFDHQIPVNNIQLTPNNFSDAHKYNPRKIDETLCSSASSYKMSEGEEVEKDLSSMQHTIEPGVNAVQQDSVSNGPNTVNKLVDTDDEVNPSSMEGTKELLGASFSLTVGDKSKGENISNISKQSDLKIDSLRPPLVNIEDETAKIDTITKIIENSSEDQFSNLNSREMLNDSDLMENYKQYPPMEVILKPVMKIQNATMSDQAKTEFISMDDFTHNHIPEKDATETTKESAQLSTNCEKKLPRSKETPLFVEQPNPVVLVFDLKNPLNNIRFGPTNMTDAHKYQPRQTEKSLCDYESQLTNVEHILMTTLYVRKPEPNTKQDDMFNYKKDDKFNFQSINRRSISAEKSLDDDLTQESEGNITITRRGNQELIESISSMTLVVDELEGKNRVSNENLKRSNRVTRSLPGHKKKQATKTANQSNAKLQGNSSRDPFHSSWSPKKDKKRILLPIKAKQRSLSIKITKHNTVSDKKMMKYSPCKDKQHPPPTTLKPVTKIQNVTKFNNMNDKLFSTKNCTPTPKDLTEHINQIATKISSKNKISKPGKNNTVQPFLTDYHNLEIDHKDNDGLKNKLEDFRNEKYESLRALTEASFTSSNNLRDDNASSVFPSNLEARPSFVGLARRAKRL